MNLTPLIAIAVKTIVDRVYSLHSYAPLIHNIINLEIAIRICIFNYFNSHKILHCLGDKINGSLYTLCSLILYRCLLSKEKHHDRVLSEQYFG